MKTFENKGKEINELNQRKTQEIHTKLRKDRGLGPLGALGAPPLSLLSLLWISMFFFDLIHFFDSFGLFDLCQKHWAAMRQK